MPKRHEGQAEVTCPECGEGTKTIRYEYIPASRWSPAEKEEEIVAETCDCPVDYEDLAILADEAAEAEEDMRADELYDRYRDEDTYRSHNHLLGEY